MKVLPSSLDYGIDAKDTRITFQIDPTGTLHVEVRPQGLKRILNVDNVGSVLGVTIALLFGIGVPVAGAIWVWRYRGEVVWLFLVPFALAIAAVVPLAIWLSRATRHVRISANAKRLTLWTNGPMDPRSFEWRREDIVKVEAKWTDDGEIRTGGLIIHSRRKTDMFLEFLPDATVMEIAEQIQKALVSP